MKTVHVNAEDPPSRAFIRDARWLVLQAADWGKVRHLTMFAELDGALVAIDARGANLDIGADVQRRAVHLLLVDDVIEASRLQATTGITKVVAGHAGAIDDLLW